jgi:hypothetical protein
VREETFRLSAPEKPTLVDVEAGIVVVVEVTVVEVTTGDRGAVLSRNRLVAAFQCVAR